MKTSTTKGPTRWDTVPFSECLDPAPIAKLGKLLARDYKLNGNYPVIDQGQDFIAGWSDDDSLVIRHPLPLVIFGDHTRAFKFVDFPFVLGADGTQILKPALSFDPRFFYFACLQLDIPNRGYNRHYTLLKQQFLPRPPTSEQKRIAGILWKVQRAIEIEDKLIATTCELKKATMRQLFTFGTRGERQKDSELGPIPESWDIVRLGNVCRLSTGTTPATKRTDYYLGQVPFIKTFEIVNNRIAAASTFLSAEAVADYSLQLYPAGTVLMAMYGQGKTRGQVALLEIAAATTQNAAAIQPGGDLDSDFLWQYLLSSYDRLRGMGSLGHLSHLNLGYLREFTLMKPPISEQREIADILQIQDRNVSIHTRKRAALAEIFTRLRYEFMNCKIRVEHHN